jgi:hypothetical protein
MSIGSGMGSWEELESFKTVEEAMAVTGVRKPWYWWQWIHAGVRREV